MGSPGAKSENDALDLPSLNTLRAFEMQLAARPTNTMQPDGDLVQAYIRDRKRGGPYREDLRIRELPRTQGAA